MKKLILGTQNSHKVEELRKIFPSSWEILSVADLGIDDSPAENGQTFVENAIEKALFFSHLLPEEYVMADDSGLEVSALNGAPGIYSKRYAVEDGNSVKNNAKVLRELAGVPPEKRRAQFRCASALAKGGEVLFYCEGICRGMIALECRGTGGFGYDPLFIYPPWSQTFGEVPEKKQAVSHRFLAMRALGEFLG